MACRLLLRAAAIAAVVAAGAQVPADHDDPWTVVCNTDCDGVNTCAQKQLCAGEEVESTACLDNPKCPASEDRCPPVPCIWESWLEWQNDGKSGLCTRSRGFQPNRCGGAPCIGTVSETMYCDPVELTGLIKDCEFSTWDKWGACDIVTLQRVRARTIAVVPSHGGRPCKGALSQTEPCGVRHGPQDCVIGEWMAWSGCSHTCGGGQQLRMRAIVQQAARGGKLCGTGGVTQTMQNLRACNTDRCIEQEVKEPQDCVLGAWTGWSPCNEAERQMYRQREVQVPAAYGGVPCQSQLKETYPCKVQLLIDGIQDCQLSEWTPWSLCSSTCMGGQTSRQRHITVQARNGGRQCEGGLEETQPCNEFACSIDPESNDCLLSGWSSWSPCSSQCGSGLQTRGRIVRVPASEGGMSCTGNLEEARACEDTKECAKDDCEWADWSSWSRCSQSCGGGQRGRNRTVLTQPSKGGRSCEAFESTNEVEACSTTPCYEDCADGKWADWEAWTSCSRTCGRGVMWRHRKVARTATPCGKPALGEAAEEMECNTDLCAGDEDCLLSEWADWAPCSRSCDGVTFRKRTIAVMGKGAGKWCTENASTTAALTQVESCNGPKDLFALQAQPGVNDTIARCGFSGNEPVDCAYMDWSEWTKCSATCDGGQTSRDRRIRALAQHGGAPCTGELRQISTCNPVACMVPEDCRWGTWGPWSQCTKCDGLRVRLRGVARQGNSRGQACDAGASKEVQRCGECQKQKTRYCVWGKWAVGECSVTCGTGGWRKKVRDLISTDVWPKEGLQAVVGNVTGDGARCEGSEVDYDKCTDVPYCDQAQCKPQECQLGAWSDWEQPHNCEGVCTRQRTVAKPAACGGIQCVGVTTERKKCENQGCRLNTNCEFALWGPWSPCGPDDTQRTRQRSLLTQAGPSGQACLGTLQETESCPMGNSTNASDCLLSEWEKWSACSKSCEGGNQERSRQILKHASGGGKACQSVMQEVQSCNTRSCAPEDIDCILQDWSDWSDCENTDGVRQATRKRQFQPARGNGLPCDGSLMEAGACPETHARDCQWGDWADWGECGHSCGGGQRFRTREVLVESANGGNPCEGDLAETGSCNEVPCSEDDCQVSSWGAWSLCDGSCSAGHQTRKRQVVQAGHNGGLGCTLGLSEVRGCEGNCTEHGECMLGAWSEWSGCVKAQFCGIGYKKRTRSVPGAAAGKRCPVATTEEVQPAVDCPGSCESEACVDGVWDDWTDWDQCSVTCGPGGVRSRDRVLKVQANECGKPAEGDSREYATCSSDVPCEALGPVVQQDCVFGLWTAWQPAVCALPCNGEQRRTRTIVRYSANGGKPCGGSTSEIKRCNPGPGELDPLGCESGAPIDCVLQDWSSWSECSAQCGTGHRARQRKIALAPKFAGLACENPLEELQECNATQPCVDWSADCKFADWEPWGECNPMTGEKVRQRGFAQLKLGSGVECTGPVRQVGKCPRQCEDKRYKCEWAPWSVWSQCSTTCGNEGRQTRVRQLQLGNLHSAVSDAGAGLNATAGAAVPAAAFAAGAQEAAPAAADPALAAATPAPPAAPPINATPTAYLMKYGSPAGSAWIGGPAARRHQELAVSFALGLLSVFVLGAVCRVVGSISRGPSRAAAGLSDLAAHNPLSRQLVVPSALVHPSRDLELQT